MKVLQVLAVGLVAVKGLAQNIPTNLALKGVSLAGAEYAVDQWGYGVIPGTFGQTYKWAHPSYGYSGLDYFVKKGMTAFRVPFRWERIQPVRGSTLDKNELLHMTTTVSGITARGLTVLLDMHNYMRYRVSGSSHYNDISIVGQGAVTIAHFADAWGRLAAEFKDDPKVIFTLMNEPHDVDMPTYYKSIQAAINAIRATGATNIISVMGGNWGGVMWYSPQTNANTMLATIKDPLDKILWDGHLYMDSNAAGTLNDCVSTTIGVERITAFTNWLVANKQIGILSEFGTGTTSTCHTATDNLLTHMEKYAAYYAGWIWWDAGPGPVMSGPSAFLSIEPHNGVDKPEMAPLVKHLSVKLVAAAPPSSDLSVVPKSTTCSNKLYSQCGGQKFMGNNCCPSGTACKVANQWWSDCQAGSAAVVVTPAAPKPAVVVAPAACNTKAMAKCGGIGFTGSTCCPSGYYCKFSNPWWSDCQAKTTTGTCTNKAYAQCGGAVFGGKTCCPSGFYCKLLSPYWSYCAKSTSAFDEAAAPVYHPRWTHGLDQAVPYGLDPTVITNMFDESASPSLVQYDGGAGYSHFDQGATFGIDQQAVDGMDAPEPAAEEVYSPAGSPDDISTYAMDHAGVRYGRYSYEPHD